ncbi:MAG: hypothetical protein ACTHOI_04595 [Sphingomicrobium sp.]
MYPLVAYETSIPDGVLCGLIVHYLESPGELLAGEHSSLALVMRPEMARQLAAALMKAAQRAEHKAPSRNAH